MSGDGAAGDEEGSEPHDPVDGTEKQSCLDVESDQGAECGDQCFANPQSAGDESDRGGERPRHRECHRLPGFEIDAALRYHDTREPIFVQLQYGVLFPFGAFDRSPAQYNVIGDGDARAVTVAGDVGDGQVSTRRLRCPKAAVRKRQSESRG